VSALGYQRKNRATGLQTFSHNSLHAAAAWRRAAQVQQSKAARKGRLPGEAPLAW
jgi:hypothetical protein